MCDELKLREFVDAIASPAPAPGGGGASALAGAVGAALGDMVGELTVGKPRYQDAEADLRAAMEKAQSLKSALMDCIAADAKAFGPLAKAYGIPKDTPGREETLERCLRDAAAVPCRIFTLCCETIGLLEIFGEKGSRLMLSDAATGAAITRGALFGAAVNVRVNTRLMKDRAYAEQLDREIDEKLEIYGKRAEDLLQSIYKSL